MRFGFLRGVPPTTAYALYNNVSALGDAADSISQRFVSIIPTVVDTDGRPVKNADDVLMFLKNPNSVESYKQFATNLSINYLLNTNSYIEALGFIKSKPESLYVVANDKVQESESPNTMQYTVTTTGFFQLLRGSFELTHDTGRILAKNNIQELFHVRGFNQTTSTLRSISKLTSILDDAEVLRTALSHERNALLKGLSASGVLNIDTDDPDAFAQAKADMKNRHSGPENSGEPLVVMGDTVGFTKWDLSNRDMQVLETKKDSRSTIYQRMDMPKPLIDASSQTYTNYQTALSALYDQAVLPLAEILFEALTNIFQLRGMLKENQFLTFDPRSISALQIRRNEEMKLLASIGILTRNELRAQAGYEAVEGGDVVFINSNLIPLGADRFTDDNLDAPVRRKFLKDMAKAGTSEDEAKRYWSEFQEIS